jgi:hypothetical protein
MEQNEKYKGVYWLVFLAPSAALALLFIALGVVNTAACHL